MAIENTLKENGMVAGDLRGLMADKIRWERLTALLESNSAVPSSVVDIEFQRERELVTASVVDFKLEDFKKDIEVSDDELQAYYDEQQKLVPTREARAKGRLEAEQQAALDLIMADEQRKVEFVFIAEPAAPLPPPPVMPGQTPPPLLQPGPGAAPGGLQAPPVQTIEIPGGDESEPPGQAPEEAAAAVEEAAAPLEEAAAGLEVGDLPAPPEMGDLESQGQLKSSISMWMWVVSTVKPLRRLS